jgi:hypothetical protein
MLELIFILRAVKVTFRFCYEAGIVDLPKFVATDSNAFSRAARSRVGSRRKRAPNAPCHFSRRRRLVQVKIIWAPADIS